MSLSFCPCTGRNTMKLLVIDDDEELCLELGEILKKEGFEVDVAFDGHKGMERVQKEVFNVVILDLRLPGLSGFDVLKRIKETTKIMKVLVLSGRPIATDLIKQEGVASDHEDDTLKMADAVMNKPFIIQDFIQKVKSMAFQKVEENQ